MKKHKPPTCYATNLTQQFGKPGTPTRDACEKSIQSPKPGELIPAMLDKHMPK